MMPSISNMATNSSVSTLQNQHGGSTSSLSLRSNVTKAPLPTVPTATSSNKSIDFSTIRRFTASDSSDSSTSASFKRGRTYSLTRQRSLTEIASDTAASVFGSAQDQGNSGSSQAVEYLSGKLSNALSFLTSNVTASASSSPATGVVEKPMTGSFASAHVRSLSNLTDEDAIYSNIDYNPKQYDSNLRFLSETLPKPVSVPQSKNSPTSPTQSLKPSLANNSNRQNSLDQKFIIHSEHAPSNGVVKDRILQFNEISRTSANSQEKTYESSPDKKIQHLPAINSTAIIGGGSRHCRTPSGTLTQWTAPHGFSTTATNTSVINSNHLNSPTSPSDRPPRANGEGFSFLPRNNTMQYSKPLTDDKRSPPIQDMVRMMNGGNAVIGGKESPNSCLDNSSANHVTSSDMTSFSSTNQNGARDDVIKRSNGSPEMSFSSGSSSYDALKVENVQLKCEVREQSVKISSLESSLAELQSRNAKLEHIVLSLQQQQQLQMQMQHLVDSNGRVSASPNHVTSTGGTPTHFAAADDNSERSLPISSAASTETEEASAALANAVSQSERGGTPSSQQQYKQQPANHSNSSVNLTNGSAAAAAIHHISASAAATVPVTASFQSSPSSQGGKVSPPSSAAAVTPGVGEGGSMVAPPAFDISPTEFDPNDPDQDDTYAALSHEYSSITRYTGNHASALDSLPLQHANQRIFSRTPEASRRHLVNGAASSAGAGITRTGSFSEKRRFGVNKACTNMTYDSHSTSIEENQYNSVPDLLDQGSSLSLSRSSQNNNIASGKVSNDFMPGKQPQNLNAHILKLLSPTRGHVTSPPLGAGDSGGDSPHGSLSSQTNDSPPPASMGGGEEFSRNSVTRSTAGPRMMLNNRFDGGSPVGVASGNSSAVAQQLQNTPFKYWDVEQIAYWLTTMGLNRYVGSVNSQQVNAEKLARLTPVDMEKCLKMKSQLHRKKLLLAVRAQLVGNWSEFAAMDGAWVARWLDDIGLPQYKDAFAEACVDGRVLHYLTFDDFNLLKIHSAIHQISIGRAVQYLRTQGWKSDTFVRRSESRPTNRTAENESEMFLLHWSNHRVMEWLRSIDLSEYAPNLRGSGVHGALMCLEPRFTADTLADLLHIASSKTLLRRHLVHHFDTLVGPFCKEHKRLIESSPHYQPLNINYKVKPPSKSRFRKNTSTSSKGGGSKQNKGGASPGNLDDLVCPLEFEVPRHVPVQVLPMGYTITSQDFSKSSPHLVEQLTIKAPAHFPPQTTVSKTTSGIA